jgi:hypothetical protein
VANRGGGLLPHTVEFTITNLRKKIGGVPCVVVWDRDVNEGELRESELSFWAPDDFGNVWNTAEYPEEYQNGVLLGAENTWVLPVCVPAGCYKSWVIIREWAPVDGCDVIQVKTYAKRVGIVQVGAIDDPEGETLNLVSVRTLELRGAGRRRLLGAGPGRARIPRQRQVRADRARLSGPAPPAPSRRR